MASRTKKHPPTSILLVSLGDESPRRGDCLGRRFVGVVIEAYAGKKQRFCFTPIARGRNIDPQTFYNL